MLTDPKNVRFETKGDIIDYVTEENILARQGG